MGEFTDRLCCEGSGFASHAEEGFPVKVSFVIRKWQCDAKSDYPHRNISGDHEQ